MAMPDVANSIETTFADHGFDAAMLELGAELEALASQRYIQGVFVAVPFAMAGEVDKAVAWLETAYEQRDPMMPYIATMASTSRIAGDARFERILALMNLSSPEGVAGP
ncbi:MAG: hypothetical protein AAFX10_10095 [Pseudomonadota bacterium]